MGIAVDSLATVVGGMEKTALVHKAEPMLVEVGEVRVDKNDLLSPGKLRLLGSAGWSVVSAMGTKDGGFQLLLQRQYSDRRTNPKKEAAHVVHEGSIRCPQYCNCEIMQAPTLGSSSD